jgi:hypothetical protein
MQENSCKKHNFLKKNEAIQGNLKKFNSSDKSDEVLSILCNMYGTPVLFLSNKANIIQTNNYEDIFKQICKHYKKYKIN